MRNVLVRQAPNIHCMQHGSPFLRAHPHEASGGDARPRILVIEDDPDVAELIRINLSNKEYAFAHRADGLEGLEAAQNPQVDCILLDVALPGMDGYQIARKLREGGIQTPILMLTARGDEVDTVTGLESGADDYLTKPFRIRELQARIRALLRRNRAQESSTKPTPTLRYGDLEIDPQGLWASKRGERLTLTNKEFRLLHTLAKQPGRTWTRQQLLREVWGQEFHGYEHTVNSHINRLRTKLEDEPAQPQYVLTSWGQGYRFSEDA